MTNTNTDLNNFGEFLFVGIFPISLPTFLYKTFTSTQNMSSFFLCTIKGLLVFTPKFYMITVPMSTLMKSILKVEIISNIFLYLLLLQLT